MNYLAHIYVQAHYVDTSVGVTQAQEVVGNNVNVCQQRKTTPQNSAGEQQENHSYVAIGWPFTLVSNTRSTEAQQCNCQQSRFHGYVLQCSETKWALQVAQYGLQVAA